MLGGEHRLRQSSSIRLISFSFHLQLEDAPDSLYTIESNFLRSSNRGPGNRFQHRDLFKLPSNYGFATSFPSLRTTSPAAKLRVVEFKVVDVRQRAARSYDEWLESEPCPFQLQ